MKVLRARAGRSVAERRARAGGAHFRASFVESNGGGVEASGDATPPRRGPVHKPEVYGGVVVMLAFGSDAATRRSHPARVRAR